MDSVVGSLMSSFSEGNLSMLGKRVGTDGNGAKSIMGTVVPLLTVAMAKTSAQPDGANTLMRMLGGGRFESTADDIGGICETLMSPAGQIS
jgi:hypothetical protein